MTARDYRDALLKHWRFIVLLVLATGLGALLASQFMTHLYRSSALVQIVVNPAVTNPSSVLAGDSLINTQILLATSPTLLADIAKRYPGLNESQLSSEVAATNYGNANLMRISVLDTSPARAASLANDIAATVIAKQEQIREQQNALYLKPLTSQLNTIEQSIENTAAALAALPDSPSNADKKAQLQTRLADLNAQKSDLEANISRIQVEQALKGFSLQLAQPARPDPTPVRPVVLGNVVSGVVFGLIAGLLLVLLGELLSQRAPATEAVIASFGWPLLATLETTPIVLDESKAARTEGTEITGHSSTAYRQIESAVRLWDIESPVRSLVISSFGAEESAQQVAARLAIQLAASGDRTLLVDANVERPSLASRFGIEPQPGLSDAVMACQTPVQSDQAVAAVAKVLQRPTTLSAPSLRIMSAGGPWPNPMRVFRSVAMGRLAEALLASGAQRVLYSAPPLLHSGAARTLASRMDGILLVVDPGQIRRDKIQRANATFVRTGVRVLGYVLVLEPDQDVARVGAAAPSGSGKSVRMTPLEVVRTRHGRA